MENDIIMSMTGGDRHINYKTYSLASGLFGLFAGGFGFYLLYILLNDKVYEPDRGAVWALCLIFIFFCPDLIQMSINFNNKAKKSEFNYLTIRENTIGGRTNGTAFTIDNKDIVSVSIQICSVAANANGSPSNFTPGIYVKMCQGTSKYLCIVTSSGTTYYIDCLTSPESAKNTLDAIITKNNLNKMAEAKH